jgi:hypothetical protein
MGLVPSNSKVTFGSENLKVIYRFKRAVDRHRFDADPNPTFHFLMPIQIGKSEFLFFTFINSSASLHCFIFLVSVTAIPCWPLPVVRDLTHDGSWNTFD